MTGTSINIWKYIWENITKYTALLVLIDNSIKLWIMWCLTPSGISRRYKTGNDRCWKCRADRADFIHCWWNYPEAKKYWHETVSNINNTSTQYT